MMKQEIIVTDLTRFTDDKVCLAGINSDTMKLIRPMPYVNQAYCIENKILPGTKITACFTPKPDRIAPHLEDCFWDSISVTGKASSEEFKNLLDRSLATSIESGFNVPISGKLIPACNPPELSIITVKGNIKLHPGYKDDFSKPKISIRDFAGHNIQYLPLADLGFFRFIQRMKSPEELYKLQNFINMQTDIYLRIGLGRCWTHQDGRNGYWLQVNGIYTFPEFLREIRAYE